MLARTRVNNCWSVPRDAQMHPPKGFISIDACIVKRGFREIPEFGLWFLRDSLEFAFLFLECHTPGSSALISGYAAVSSFSFSSP